VDPVNPQLPTTSCVNPTDKRENAYPPRRIVRVAKDFGENAVVYSICADDYAPALDKVIEKIAAKLRGNCLPRQLTPDTSGLVQCEVYELLPPDETNCNPARGHEAGPPVPRTFTSGTTTEPRLACHMNQVAVKNGVPDASKVGWYYDDFSPSLKDDCNTGEQQRIQFSFEGGLPPGAGAVIDCLQPVASVNPNAKGLAAIGSRCDPDPTVCDKRSDDDYTLICTQNTCQISCSNNPDCPPGWQCAALNDAGPKICQLATCPAAPSVEQEQAAP
jgi:hypothetical protein